MVLEVLGLIFVGLIVVVFFMLAGMGRGDWMSRSADWQDARAAFWFFFVAGIVLLVVFSYLSAGASVWAPRP